MIKCKSGKVTISDSKEAFNDLGKIVMAVKQMYTESGVDKKLVNSLILEVTCKALDMKGESDGRE